MHFLHIKHTLGQIIFQLGQISSTSSTMLSIPTPSTSARHTSRCKVPPNSPSLQGTATSLKGTATSLGTATSFEGTATSLQGYNEDYKVPLNTPSSSWGKPSPFVDLSCEFGEFSEDMFRSLTYSPLGCSPLRYSPSPSQLSIPPLELPPAVSTLPYLSMDKSLIKC